MFPGSGGNSRHPTPSLLKTSEGRNPENLDQMCEPPQLTETQHTSRCCVKVTGLVHLSSDGLISSNDDGERSFLTLELMEPQMRGEKSSRPAAFMQSLHTSWPAWLRVSITLWAYSDSWRCSHTTCPLFIGSTHQQQAPPCVADWATDEEKYRCRFRCRSTRLYGSWWKRCRASAVQENVRLVL